MKRLFSVCLTNFAPSANYGGDSGGGANRPIQKITRGRVYYPIVSSEAIRSAWREGLRDQELKVNRSRVQNSDSPKVFFEAYPNEDVYADDFFFGLMVTKSQGTPKKRDSVLRVNKALGVWPYRQDSVLHQYSGQQFGTASPKKKVVNEDEEDEEGEETGKTKGGGLYQSEVTWNAFQYPIGLDLVESAKQADWTRKLLVALTQLAGVSGNQTRSFFEFNPASIVVRLTNELVSGFSQYPFTVDSQERPVLEMVDSLLNGDLPGAEFFIGGAVVKQLDVEALRAKGVTLMTSVPKLMEVVNKLLFVKELPHV